MSNTKLSNDALLLRINDLRTKIVNEDIQKIAKNNSEIEETFENYERLIWIDEGGVQADGTPRGVIKKYQDAMYKYREKNI